MNPDLTRPRILIIFLAVLLAYFPAYLFSYGFSDDYVLIGQVLAGFCDTFKWDVLSGRPTFAILRLLAYRSSITLEQLAYLRFFSALCAALLAVHLFLFLRKRNILGSDLYRTLLSIVLCVTPSFQVYTAWATCSVYVFAVWLSFISFDVLTSKEIRSTLVKIALSFLLITLSFSIYQPAAMAFLAFAFLDFCVKSDRVNNKAILLTFIMAIIGICSSFIMTKFIPTIIYDETFARAGLSHDFIGKIEWFIRRPLIIGIANYDVQLHISYFIISVIIIMLGLRCLVQGEEGGKKIFLACVLCVGSFSLNLIVSESWATWRTLIGMSIILTSTFMLGIFSISQKMTPSSNCLAVVATSLIVLSCQFNILRGFVLPQREELQAFAAELSNKVGKDYKGEIMIDISHLIYPFSDMRKTDEFGNISLATGWAPWGMALYLKSTKGFSYTIPYKSAISSENPCGENCIAINPAKAMQKAEAIF